MKDSNNNQSKIILLIILVIVLFGIFGLLFFLNGGFSMLKNNNTSNNSNKSIAHAKAEKLSDFDDYFSVTAIIDSLYENISLGRADQVVAKYSSEYLNSKSLNSSNIIEQLNPSLETSYRFATDLYISCNIKNCYYFAKLDGFIIYEADERTAKLDTEYMMIVVDLETKGYKITPVTNVTNIEEYATNYPYKDVDIIATADNTYNYKSMNNEYVIRYYLSFVSYILSLDEPNSSKYINNYYSSVRYTYLQKLGNTLYNYSVSRDDNMHSFKGMLLDGTTFTIVSETPMNFKITIH